MNSITHADVRGLTLLGLQGMIIPPAQRVRLPMRAGQRSLNLSNAAAVAVFDAWRQLGYADGV